jgi:transcriptional regulator with XRE-family HTH domain
MWVSLHGRWNSDVQPFEKFLTELIIQRCDYTESISNKYRTTNGYIQVKELIRLCNLTFKRSRSVKSLKILIEEATSPLIKQNIAHDVVIDKYFVSLKKFIREYPRDALIGERNSPSLEALHKLLHALKIFEAQLDRYYFSALKKEFLSFDYVSEEKFQTKAETLSALVDLLIPYLIFHGYSVASINEVLISWVVRGYRPTARRIFDFFHFKKRPFYFLQFLGEPSPETDAFLNLLRTDLQTEITTVKASELASNFLTEHGIPANRLFASYVVETLDPHNHVRNTYDRLLKRLVMRRERKSLAAFNDFFNNSFWSHRPLRNMKPIALREDAINVSSRGRTLFTTVKKCALSYGYTFSTEADIPIVANHTLRNAIYYYNLALASKSIENSLSLLWTALETIIPYRTMGSDIECVQEFICKSLGSGAISRDVYAFATRFIQSNQNNSHMLSSLGTMEFEALPSPKGLHQWFM